MGAILAPKWALSLYYHLIWSCSCSCYKWKPVMYSKFFLHFQLLAVFFFCFLKWCHSTLFCNFNLDFKCLLSSGKCFFPLHVFSGAVRVINWITLQHLLLWLLFFVLALCFFTKACFPSSAFTSKFQLHKQADLGCWLRLFSAQWLLYFFVLNLMLPIQQSRGI